MADETRVTRVLALRALIAAKIKEDADKQKQTADAKTADAKAAREARQQDLRDVIAAEDAEIAKHRAVRHAARVELLGFLPKHSHWAVETCALCRAALAGTPLPLPPRRDVGH